MSRRRRQDDSSLELLLDTICNTFGGILFISLLVVVLLNTTSKAMVEAPPSAASKLAMMEADIERKQLTNELEQLKKADAQQKEVIGVSVPSDVIEKAQELREREADRARLLVQKSKTVGDLTNAQDQLNQFAQAAADGKARLGAAQKQLAALQHVLNQAIASNTRTAVMPKAREAQVDERVYFLKQGKLYGPHLVNGSLNTSDFIEIQQANGSYLDINPSGGVLVDPTGQNTASLADCFAGLDPAYHGAKIFVWPDSYEYFDAVRIALGQAGVGYELFPVDSHDNISFGPSSSSGMLLQ